VEIVRKRAQMRVKRFFIKRKVKSGYFFLQIYPLLFGKEVKLY